MIVNLTEDEIAHALENLRATMPSLESKLADALLNRHRPADFDDKVNAVLRQRNTSGLTECECDFVVGAIVALQAIDPEAQPHTWWAMAPMSARPILDTCPEPRFRATWKDNVKKAAKEATNQEIEGEIAGAEAEPQGAVAALWQYQIEQRQFLIRVYSAERAERIRRGDMVPPAKTA